jgi:endoribonuclease L-PSP, putative
MKQEIRTPDAPQPAGPYSQGIIAGTRIYVAGQRPTNPATGTIPEGITAQAVQTLNNVKAVLEAGGATLDDVVKVGVYLADIAYFAEFNEVYKQFFTAPYPVRTTVSCSLRGFLVEVDAIAERS